MSATLSVSPASTEDEARALLERARAGDRSAVPDVRRILGDPAQVEWLGGDLARQATQSMINAAAGEDLVFREAMTRKLELLREELAGPNPTPVERLLVERVVACWLQVSDADVRYAQAQGSLTVTQGDYHQRRMDRAHRRFLSAVKTLALVRKLALPSLRVNVVMDPATGAGPVRSEGSARGLRSRADRSSSDGAAVKRL